MKIAIIAGNVSETLRDKILSERDNLDIEAFETLDDFGAYVTQRSSDFLRVVICSAKLDISEKDIDFEMKNFRLILEENCRATRVVLLDISSYNTGYYVEAFDKYFSEDIYTTMQIGKLNPKMLDKAVTGDIKEIARAYSNRKEIEYKVKINKYVDSVVQEENQEKESESAKTPKRGLFSGLFGKTRKESLEKETTEMEKEDCTESDTVKVEVQDEKIIENCENSELNKDVPTNNDDEKLTMKSDFQTAEIDEQTDDFSENIENQRTCDFHVEPTDFAEIETEVEPYSEITNEVEVENLTEEIEFEPVVDVDSVIDEELYFDIDSFNVEEDKNLESEKQEIDSEIVIEDYENYTIEDTTETDEFVEGVDILAEAVSDDIGNIDISSEKNERELYKEVREVRVEVKGKSKELTPVEKIFKGNKETFIVTGDRGTGITSTAIQIADLLSKRCSVLYVDMDAELHGLLSHIDYDKYSKYNESSKISLNVVRNKKSLHSCVARYSENLYLLSTDYGVCVTDHQLENVQSVIADCSSDFDVIVVDLPFSKIHLCEDLIVGSRKIICCEPTLRGVTNLATLLEFCELKPKFKRNIMNTSKVLYSTRDNKFRPEGVMSALEDRVDFDEYNWTKLEYVINTSNIDLELLNRIMEG